MPVRRGSGSNSGAITPTRSEAVDEDYESQREKQKAAAAAAAAEEQQEEEEVRGASCASFCASPRSARGRQVTLAPQRPLLTRPMLLPSSLALALGSCASTPSA